METRQFVGFTQITRLDSRPQQIKFLSHEYYSTLAFTRFYLSLPHKFKIHLFPEKRQSVKAGRRAR